MEIIGKKVVATVQHQTVTGTVLKYRRTQTIETIDNPEPENVLLYRVKFDKAVNVLCDDILKPFKEMWVDNTMVEMVS